MAYCGITVYVFQVSILIKCNVLICIMHYIDCVYSRVIFILSIIIIVFVNICNDLFLIYIYDILIMYHI